MHFKKEVFEKLLFPLNNKIYEEIENKIIECIYYDKCFIEKSINISNMLHNIPAFEKIKLEYKKLYAATIVVNVFSDDYRINNLRNTFPIVGFDPNNTGWKLVEDYPGNTLVVNIGKSSNNQNFNNKMRIDAYKIPLEYVLGYKYSDILEENSYQLYLHTIVPKSEYYNEKFILNNAFLYVGITKRTWQKRYQEHKYNSMKGSQLLFHQALRGEKCEIGMIEHCVEKAGLEEDEALNLEEKEVENRSLNIKHKLGLNMIPGGKAGLKFIKNFANHNKININKNINAENKEEVLVELHMENMRILSKEYNIEYKKEKMKKLWEELTERIKFMTRQYNRFSLTQIQNARTMFLSGYDIEKIYTNLKELDESKIITIQQLEKLLKNETYESIPYTLL